MRVEEESALPKQSQDLLEEETERPTGRQRKQWRQSEEGESQGVDEIARDLFPAEGRRGGWLIALLFFGAGLLVNWIWPVALPDDLSSYLVKSWNLKEGLGLSDASGTLKLSRPLFPALMSFAEWLGGEGIKSAYFVVWFATALCPALLYLFARRIFGPGIALTAGLFAFTSYPIHYYGYRHLDALWPALILLGMLALVKAFTVPALKRWWFLAGFAYGCAALTKELAIVFAVAPLLCCLWHRALWRREWLRGSILTGAVTIGLFFSWALITVSLGDGGQVAGGRKTMLLRDLFERGTIELLLEGAQFFIRGLQVYLKKRILTYFYLGPLIVAAWLYIALRALRGELHSKLLLSHLIVYLPFLSYIGYYSFRVGQGILIFLFGALALALLVHQGSWWLARM
ncbi:MAG: glycosyltransferase family 39 protein, partial [Myxococcota bacterium]|nr:glycosyltransferase family 39 protein [Myxococcota bacterium]